MLLHTLIEMHSIVMMWKARLGKPHAMNSICNCSVSRIGPRTEVTILPSSDGFSLQIPLKQPHGPMMSLGQATFKVLDSELEFQRGFSI